MQHNGRFFVPMGDSGIWVAIRGGSPDTFDVSLAYWRAPNGNMIRVSLRDGGFYQQVTEGGEEFWRLVARLMEGFLCMLGSDFTSSSTAASTTTTRPASTNSGGGLTTAAGGGNAGQQNIPKTGDGVNTAALVATIVLTMGLGYFGYRFFKKDEEEAITAA